MNQFEKYQFHEWINSALISLNFANPTIVQEKVIPLLLNKTNIICQAHTGTGKTHAFLLPILHNLNLELKATQAIIVVPTRELANQITQQCRFFKKFNSNLTIGKFIGGQELSRKIDQLSKNNSQIIITTPTKLKELFDNKVINLKFLQTIILDECDMILDLGFLSELDYVLSKVSSIVSASVFSATIPKKFELLFDKYFEQPKKINLTNNKPSANNINHVLIPTKHQDRGKILLQLLDTINPYLAIIFVNKKNDVEKYFQLLQENNFSVCQIHSNLPPRIRQQSLKRIKNLEYKYVIATDVFARGIDIEGVTHIISLDLPYDLDYYIHRSGRTGRNNANGYSYILYDTKNKFLIDQLKKRKINFEVQKWSNNYQLVVQKKEKKVFLGDEKDHEVLKIINKYPNKNNDKVIKPGYRKKRQLEIEKLLQQRKREKIKLSIKRIKKIRAKERGKRLFENK